MKYRRLGNTGLMVSEIGLGCEGFVGKSEEHTKELFSIATKAGVNFIDMYSPEPGFRRNIGRFIKNIRGTYILQSHLCAVWQDGQYKATRNLEEVKNGFEDMIT